MGLDTLLTFILASTILSFAPGPDNIFVLTQSALHGKKTGILITLGLCTGLCVHTFAVALGIAAIFMLSVTAFTMLKFIGAAYLVYLAWLAFKASAATIDTEQTPILSHWALYRRGIIMNITNPKVAIFFLAFLPQFADSQSSSLSTQLMLLGLVFIIVALLVFCFIATIAGVISAWLKHSPSAQKIMNRIAGLVFLGLALKLAVSTR